MILEPQLEGKENIELLVLEDNRKRLMGDKWQSMIDIAQGEYISFIDDDDLVSEKYVDTILPLLDGVDCVGFTGHISINESKTLQVFYSKEYTEDRNEEIGFFRYVQHLNPIRSDIVRAVKYSGHNGADKRWTDEIKQLDLIHTENLTNEALYYYVASTEDSREGVWF